MFSKPSTEGIITVTQRAIEQTTLPAVRWYYRYRGSFYANGPTTGQYRTPEEAATAIFGWYPDEIDSEWPDIEVWPASPTPVDGTTFGEWLDDA